MTNTALIHRSGYDVTNIEDKSMANLLEYADLNWDIIQRPIYSEFGMIPGYVGNYRDDNHTLLGIVSEKTYKVVNNKTAFSFIDEINGFTIERIGAHQGGKSVFVVGKSDYQIKIDSDDYIHEYISFLHSYTGKSGIQVIISPYRIHCTNQVNLIDKCPNKFSIKHTKCVHGKLYDIHRVLNAGHQYMDSLQETISKLINEKIPYEIGELVEHLIPIEAIDTPKIKNNKQYIRSDIVSLYNNKPDNQNYKGTKFGFINAVADYVSHQDPKRCKEKESTNTNLFIRNIQNNDLLNKAFELVA